MATMAVVLIATGFAPVGAITYELNVHNNTEDDIHVKLIGPETYEFTMGPGKLQKTVVAGTYEYKVDACETTISGTITVEDDGQWLIVDPCIELPELTKFAVFSRVGEPITISLISLDGLENYELTVEIGQNKFFDLYSGYYVYSFEVCGRIFSDTIRITKNGKTRLTIKSCEAIELIEDRLEFGIPNPVKMRIANHFSVAVDITLVGPKSYFLRVSPGINRYDLISGTYNFFYAAYGRLYEGIVTVYPNGSTLMVIPRFTSTEVE